MTDHRRRFGCFLWWWWRSEEPKESRRRRRAMMIRMSCDFMKFIRLRPSARDPERVQRKSLSAVIKVQPLPFAFEAKRTVRQQPQPQRRGICNCNLHSRINSAFREGGTEEQSSGGSIKTCADRCGVVHAKFSALSGSAAKAKASKQKRRKWENNRFVQQRSAQLCNDSDVLTQSIQSYKSLHFDKREKLLTYFSKGLSLTPVASSAKPRDSRAVVLLLY
jgi:hypothetical protein